MTAVWFRFRAELRTRWRAWLGLALIVGLGVVAVPRIPLVVIALLIPCAVLVANLVAAAPAAAAARTRPATVLKAE